MSYERVQKTKQTNKQKTKNENKTILRNDSSIKVNLNVHCSQFLILDVKL